jgi:hypothetical protein
MDIRKMIAVGLVAGLVAASFTTAEAAKKKKKKPKYVSQTAPMYLRNTSECDLAALSLSLTDGEDTDCFSEQNAVGSAIGYSDHVYTASDGVPFLLDAKKALTGTITMRNGNSVGAGQAGVTLTLVGETGGEETQIATWESETFTIVPAAVQTLNYEAEIDDKLYKKKFTSLKLTVTPTGTTVGLYGTVEHDGPPVSVMNLPVLKKK